eukprot:3050097-Prymnesium_polylepis.1
MSIGSADSESDDSETTPVTSPSATRAPTPAVNALGAAAVQPQRRVGGKGAKRAWTLEEDALLRELVARHGPARWSSIATKLGGREGKQCRERWINHLDESVSKEEWSADEDSLLAHLIQ